MQVCLFDIFDSFTQKDSQFINLGLGYIKSYFDKYSDLRDKIKITLLTDNIYNYIQEHKPALIGISSVTPYYTQAIDLAKKIRQLNYDTIIIIGGVHISTLPESFNSIFDYGIIGEGEVTVKELLEAIYNLGSNSSSIKQIKGLVYFDENKKLCINEPRPFIENIDSIPFPDRGSLYKNFRPVMLTNRGCPYDCAYCSSSVFWMRKVRSHSPEYVVNEMSELISKYKARHITIWDDIFTLDIKRLNRIVELIRINKKYFRSITFGVSTRPNVVSYEFCDLLKKMNVISISMGIESGSDRMLERLKRGYRITQAKEAIDILRKYFMVNVGFFIGSPDETEADLKATFNFIKETKPDSGGVGIAVPFPGTVFWDYATKKGLVNNSMDFSVLQLTNDFTHLNNSNFILLTEHISKKNILEAGCNIQKNFALRNTISLLNFRRLAKHIMFMFRNPSFSYNILAGRIKNILKSFLNNK